MMGGKANAFDFICHSFHHLAAGGRFGHQRFTFARYTCNPKQPCQSRLLWSPSGYSLTRIVGYSDNCLTPDGARYSFATGGSVARIQKSVLLIVEPRKSA